MLKKPIWFNDIKVMVWDLDGTFYQDQEELRNMIGKRVVELIAQSQKISLGQAKQLFSKLYFKLNSSHKTMLACGVNKDYVLSGDWYAEAQFKFLKKDLRLNKLFKDLKRFKHILNTNSNTTHALKKLKALGLDKSVFEKIICCPDMLGRLKPDPASFKLILDYTKLPADNHLMIGDRVETDLEPAKKIGIKTCLVWGKSDEVDLNLKSVFDLNKLF